MSFENLDIKSFQTFELSFETFVSSTLLSSTARGCIHVHVSNAMKGATHSSQGRRRRGQGGGHVPPHFQKWGGHKWVVSPTFGQRKCSKFTICSYFVVKNTFFQNFLGSLRSPTLINQYFLNFAN